MAGGRHGRSGAPSHHISYFAPADISALDTLRQRKQKEPLPRKVAAPKLNYMSIARARLGLEGLLDGDSADFRGQFLLKPIQKVRGENICKSLAIAIE